MQFMYVHSHSPERCLLNKPQEAKQMFTAMQEGFQKAGIKISGSYVAAYEHTMYTILEANDLMALEKALVPMTLWGDGQLIPVTSMEAWSR
jgi:hypothetical protein